MEPSFFAIIPADVRYDKNLKPNAKLLYGEITALAQKEGFCWAGNEYFSELYNVSNETVSRWISSLKDGGYIEVTLFPNEGNKRQIAIDKKVKRSCEKSQEVLTKKSIGLDKKVKPIKEIITINNTMSKDALTFLKENAEMMFEKFCMDFKNKIRDFEKFQILFNAKFDEEDLEYKSKIINARLIRFATNYIENERAPNFKNTNRTAIQPEVSSPSYKRVRFN